MILVDNKTQTLTFKSKVYKISTAKNGMGEEEHSFKTPRGKFKICEKIGKGVEIFTIFDSRKPVAIWDKKEVKQDLILSRILWLTGIEKCNENTKQRYIYIHGTNHENQLGTAKSMGCIRMKNTDIIELFDMIKVNDKVIINP